MIVYLMEVLQDGAWSRHSAYSTREQAEWRVRALVHSCGLAAENLRIVELEFGDFAALVSQEEAELAARALAKCGALEETIGPDVSEALAGAKEPKP